MENVKLFVTGHKGFETLLFHELREILGSCDTQPIKRYGGIEIIGGIECAYRVCLYSRLANRVFFQLTQAPAGDGAQLYQAAYEIDWRKHLDARCSIAVSATVSSSSLNHSQFVALKTKDAIVDQLRQLSGSRPVVQRKQPDIQVHVNIHRDQASISLDLSGDSLHKRGYRLEHSGAPLKEHLAAAMLWQAGWNRQAAGDWRFFDPMCGSGTFAIEAAMIAANRAPGLERGYFGFNKWLCHDAGLWTSLLDEAASLVEAQAQCEIFASDYDANALEIARANAARAGVENLIQFSHQQISEVVPAASQKPALVLCNPPYGQRLQSEQGLASLYGDIGDAVRRMAPASLHIISANADLLHRLKLKRIGKKSVRNGPLDCIIAHFKSVEETQELDIPAPAPVTTIDDDLATPLANRLKKNAKHLARWAKRNGVSCYRVYDADLPDFSFALDRYQSDISPDLCWFHLQEYQAPKTIPEDRAAFRIELARKVVRQVFSIPEEQLFCKTRRRQRGRQQYQKQDNQGEYFQVREGAAALLINLSDYLDSGLFLDHRVTRAEIYRRARGKSVLNLFCYTGSFGVQAALGGADSVLNVDMSATYLKWAEENHAINGLDDATRYQFLRADVIDLLHRPSSYSLQPGYDLILLDPPSFSNSSKMQQTLDIQRDHDGLIAGAMRLLAKDGLLVFSTNKRGFRMDNSVAEGFDIRDVTPATIPEDFKRRPGIHHCWEIRQPQRK